MDKYSKLVNDAEAKTEHLLEVYIKKDPDFWKKNYDRLHDTAEGYVDLLTRFRSNEEIWIAPDENEDRKKTPFENKYFWFYVMRYVSEDFRNRYFQKMDEIQKNPTKYTLKELASELNDGKSIMFSFTTKLLNMADGKFPIYDSHVTEAMGLYEKFTYIDDPLSRYIECHKAIDEISTKLLPKNEHIIESFKKHIFRNENLSDERIFDIVLWQIGRLEQDRKKAENAAKKLAKASCVK